MNRSRKVLREVLPEHRGRLGGRWCRPLCVGYTNDVAEAGVFDAVPMVEPLWAWRQIDAEATIRGELQATEERAERLALLLEEAQR